MTFSETASVGVLRCCTGLAEALVGEFLFDLNPYFIFMKVIIIAITFSLK